ncbi:MAG: hypothetical protein J6N53_01090 [Lachnospiraceae bacterium]|nr:hypothetical protein [Lachnospiraceae bacterium]MBP3297413.1 hypothetical protein [Lachnospiraceae bacterium]
METIKNYLEAMFANLPRTPEVIKAKDELWQMMEDKYNELRAEGRSENEAVGIVISEFGNLDELAETLGLEKAVEESHELMELEPRRQLCMDEVRDFLHAQMARGSMTGIGVMFCITCPIWAILLGDTFVEGIGVLLLLAQIALAVGMFVFAANRHARWKYIYKEPCSVDYATAEYVASEKERYNPGLRGQRTMGILLCALCWVPAMLFDTIGLTRLPVMDNIVAVMLLLMVGVGVFFIVNSSIVRDSFEKILKLNDEKTMSSQFVEAQKVLYENPRLNNLMSVYWPTITCIYLSYSFLTFNWGSSWLIWPIAGIVHSVIRKNMGSNGKQA